MLATDCISYIYRYGTKTLISKNDWTEINSYGQVLN